MFSITSRTNPLVKEIVRLHKTKHRAQEQLFIAEGVRTIATLIDSGIKVEYLACTTDNYDEIQALSPDSPAHCVGEDVMQKISTAVKPSGFLGVFNIPESPSFDDITPGLVCADLTNPGNLGTLIRTAAACNTKTVVCIDGCDPWNPKVVQASAGTIGLVKIIRMTWEQLQEHKKDIPLCALVAQNGDHPKEINTTQSLLVIGNEAHGLSDEWIADCAQHLTLPMPGTTESLNAAVAGSIALYANILMHSK